MSIPRIALKPPRNANEKQPDEHSLWLWPDLVADDGIKDDACPWIDRYLLEGDTPRGAVLIFPGGGYTGRT